MDRHQYQQAKLIFYRASQLSGAERRAYLEQTCGPDAELHHEVLSLLRLDADESRTLLDSPGELAAFAREALASSDAQSVPERIDKYKIVRPIGEGGMGVVYEAAQEEPVRRSVALKLIKLGMDSREVIARFDAERRALALMEHPGIATVLDAGTSESGRPYFVMELVRGIPLAEYCDVHRLSLEARLQAFIQVCHAVQHAHVKGIVHRDLKPSNVLVATVDGRAVPKVIDFGVAKAVEQQLTEHSACTQHGQIVGTPVYMSPEQAVRRDGDIDTRTDIYSLGVMLYELLTGTTPFEFSRFKTASPAEIERIVCMEEPQRPSTRLSRAGDELSSIAERRVIDPSTLVRCLRGDLDWIVMKSIAKDREQRYESAAEFARDVRRFLDDEPTRARPPKWSYTVRKFIRRNRISVIATGSVVAAVLTGLALSISGFVKVSNLKSIAEGNAERLRYELYISRIARIQHRLENDAPLRVKELLALCDEDLRAWEWDRLNWLADRSDRTVDAHVGGVTTLMLTRAGDLLMSAGDRGEIRLWNPATLELVREFPIEEPARSHCGAVSRDGTIVASIDNNNTVRAWHVDSGALFAQWQLGGGSAAISLALDGVHKRIAVGYWMKPTELWDLDPPRLVRSLKGPLDRASALTLSEDRRRLLGGSLASPVAELDLVEGQVLFEDRSADSVTWDATYLAGESQVASIDYTGTLRVLDMRSSRPVFSIPTGKVNARVISADPTNRLIAVSGEDGIISVFDAHNGGYRYSLHGHDANVTDLAFDATGEWLFSADRNGRVKRWRTDVGEGRYTYESGNHLLAVTWSHDGRLVYFGGYGSGLKLLDAASLQVASAPIDLHDVTKIAAGERGQRLAVVGSRVAGLRYPHTVDLAKAQMTKLSDIPCDFVDISTDESFVSAAQAGQIIAWDARTGDVKLELSPPDGVNDVIFSRDGRHLLSSHASGYVRIWDWPTGIAAGAFRVAEVAVHELELDRTGERLAVNRIGAGDSVWHWRTGHKQVTLAPTDDSMSPSTDWSGKLDIIRFSNDGKRLVTCGQDFTIRIWDAQTGRLVMNAGRHNSRVIDAAFSPDGRTLVSVGEDHKLHLWATGPRMGDATRR